VIDQINNSNSIIVKQQSRKLHSLNLAVVTLCGIVITTGTAFAFQDGNETPPKTETQQKQQPAVLKRTLHTKRPRPVAAIPTHDPKDEIALGDGLIIVDTKVGDGTELQSGDIAVVRFTGWLKKTGGVFKSNMQGQKGRFITAVPGRLIEGWNRGLPGMKVGGRRLLFVPAALAYGEDGYQNIGVPANSDLVFEVSLDDIIRKPDFSAIKPQTWDDGAIVYDINKGNGPSFQQNGFGSFHVTWWNENGKLAGTSLEREQPVLIPYDAISTWSKYTPGMKSGASRVVVANVTQQKGFGKDTTTITAPRTYLIHAYEITAALNPPKYDPSKIVEGENGVKFVDIEVGSGKNLPKYALPEVNFTAWREDGTVFDTTFSPGNSPRTVTAEFDLPVWGVGLRGMHLGGKRVILCPPELGYKTDGSEKLRIKPNENLIYYVELVDFEMPLFLPPEATEDAEFMKEWNAEFGSKKGGFLDLKNDQPKDNKEKDNDKDKKDGG